MRARVPAALLAAVLILAACGTRGPDADDGGGSAAPTGESDGSDADGSAVDDDPGPGPRRTPPPAEPSVPSGPVPAPEVPAAYEVGSNETGPEAKRAAAALAEALTTYDPDDRFADVVAAATGDRELTEHLVAAAAPLHHEGAWSRGEVVYPQLGGLEEDAAAVITVVRQRLGLPDGTTPEVTRVLDIRVERDGDGWHVSALASAGGEPVARPDDLSAAAVAVLDDERIELPDTARWDIHRGAIDDTLLTLMARMAERTPYAVVVLRTGHSPEVFGTDRISRHTEGRAVDLYRVGGDRVIDDRAEGSATDELVRWLYDQPELSEVGSPWALDGFGGRSFSDRLHQDHVHVGVLRPDEGPTPPADR